MTPVEAGRLGYKKARRKILLFVKRRVEETKKKYAGKVCVCCGISLSYEKRYNKYCSHSCCARRNNKNRIVIKNCAVCGNRLGKGERKCCCPRCTNIRRQAEFVDLWFKGLHSGGSEYSVYHRVRRWLLETRGEKCELCGWNKRNPVTGKVPVQVDHKDGNAKNNRPENLALLCPNCHSLTPTFGGLNRGHGRSWRSYQWKKKPV